MISTPFVQTPPVRYGGTELVVADLAEGLVAAGHEVTLFATGDSAAACPIEALFTEPVWPPDPYHEMAHATWALGRIAGAPTPYDLVHAHVPAALALARFLDVPLVYTIHHDRDEMLQSYYLHCPSVTTVAISRRQMERQPELDRCAVIHHGLNPVRYPLGPGKGDVVFLGRLAREKGPAIAIDVARAAGMRIRIGGDAHWKDQEYFKAELEHRLRQRHVTHIGEVNPFQKRGLLGQAPAVLCPIEWDEPFGLVLIEAMLCGTPVLAFPRGSIPEIIDEGITGFVARDAEEMTRLLREEVPHIDRAACQERARERFGHERMVRDYVALYERALEAEPMDSVTDGAASLASMRC